MKESSANFIENAAINLFGDGLLTALDSLPNKDSLIEIGPGNGRTWHLYKEKGFSSIDFVDIENFLDDEIKAITDCKTCDLAFTSLPFEDNSIDVITAFEVLEHVENPWNMVREVHRVLKPGGHFLVSFPSSKDLKSRLMFLLKGDVLHFTTKNNHITFFPWAVHKKLFSGFVTDHQVFTRMRVFGTSKIQRLLGFKFFFPNRALFSSKTLFVMRKK